MTNWNALLEQAALLSRQAAASKELTFREPGILSYHRISHHNYTQWREQMLKASQLGIN